MSPPHESHKLTDIEKRHGVKLNSRLVMKHAHESKKWIKRKKD